MRIAVVLFTLAVAGQTFSASAANVRRSERPIQGEYIVTLAEGTPAGEVDRVASALAEAFGGDVIVTMENGIKAFGVRMSSSAAERMALHPLVAMVEENGEAGVSYTEISLASSDLWALNRIDQTAPVGSTPGTYKYTSDGSGFWPTSLTLAYKLTIESS